MKQQTPVLVMTDISKSFAGVTVLRDVGLRLDQGSVTGLLGENGAGKSTLIKVLCGVHEADSGTIAIDGDVVHIESTAQAQQLGIRTVYQELSLFPSLKVYENVFLHSEPTYGPKTVLSPVRTGLMRQEARRILREVLKVEIDVDQRVEDLTLAEQQLVEIARAVRSEARILILDEPTTTLEKREKEVLFSVVNDLKRAGTSIIFISHHLDEILELCDRTVVLRDGSVVVDEPTSAVDVRGMISAMSGKSPDKQYPKEAVEVGEMVLAVDAISREKAFAEVSFELHAGEILGIVGLVGCGKGDVVRALFGAERIDSGTVRVHGTPVPLRSVREARRHGISYLPSNRKVDGIFPEQSVMWNMTISSLKLFVDWFGLNGRRERATVHERVKDFRVKLASVSQEMERLSGGNQQKVLLARSLMDEPRILLLEEPTRGIDVNAKTEMYQLITGFVKAGGAVVLVSSEETEVSGMCDRILVMREGRVRATLDAATTDIDTIKIYSMSSE